MNRVFFSLALVAAGAVHAAPREPYIDPAMLKVETARNQYVEERCRDVGPTVKLDCHLRARREAATRFPYRGSPEYAQQQYGALTPDDAKHKVTQLLQQSQLARSPQVRRQPGEVSDNDLESEARWIQTHLLHVNPLDIRR